MQKTGNPVILVTGGSGFLGKNIVKELLAPLSPVAPADIRVFDIQPYNGVQNDKTTFIRSDVRNFAEIEKAC